MPSRLSPDPRRLGLNYSLRQDGDCRISGGADITGVDTAAGIHIELKCLLVRNRNGVVAHLRDIAGVGPTTRVHVSREYRHRDMHVTGRCTIAHAEQVY